MGKQSLFAQNADWCLRRKYKQKRVFFRSLFYFGVDFLGFIKYNKSVVGKEAKLDKVR